MSRPHRCENQDVPTVSRNSPDWIAQFQKCLTEPRSQIALFASPNGTAEAYPTMRLRVFGKRRAGETPILIVTPLATHDAGFIDLMRGHSLVKTLCEAEAGQVYVTDWISATPSMAHVSIDSCLADLNVALDDLGGEARVVGIGVGGLIALILAARFPGKIQRLVLAGAPVDVSVRPSLMTRFARKAIDCDELPEDEMVNGAEWLAPLGAAQRHERAAIETLQRNPASFARADLQALSAFEHWARRPFDVPGCYARELITRIYGANELARGAFVALGRRIDLKTVKIPLFVLAGAFDEITPKQQALSVMKLVGTPKPRMRSLVATCGHYSLFVGAETLAREWRTIAGWLTSSAPLGVKHAAKAG